MITFQPTDLSGVFVVEPELIADARGSFGRTYCQREFDEEGLAFSPVQCSISSNLRRGTLRGLHYQAPPWAEAKLVRCTTGAAFDVAADVRPDSPTFGRWAGVELTADNRKSLYLPSGVAHGFQTLTDGTEMLYLVSAFYEPKGQRGVRWDDQLLGIDWPISHPTAISDRDGALPYLTGEDTS
jgi:dTDP-4-dehydrorhamnose 3,5-epimerase